MAYTPEELQQLYLLSRNVIWRYRLDQYEDEALKSILASIDTAMREARATLNDFYRGSQFTIERTDELVTEFQRLTLGIKQQLANDINTTASQAGQYTIAEQNDIVSFGGRVAAFNNVALSADQFSAFFRDTPLGGNTLQEWVDAAFTGPVQDGIKREINAGVLKGEGYSDLVKRTMREATGIAKHEAISLTRNYVQSANVLAQQRVYNENSDLVEGWIWTATLESGYKQTGRGICIRCASLDGRKFKLNQGPPIPLHTRCRCFPTCAMVSYRELGMGLDELEDAARPYTLRPDENIDAGNRRTIIEVGQFQGDYASWFADQSKTVQRNLVGPGRLQLLDEGRIKFSDLVDETTGAQRTLKELMAL